MRGFIDLHSHFVASIDDGARNVTEGAAMLAELQRVGFDQVIATPHMRPGMFDNAKSALEEAYHSTLSQLPSGLPNTGLASEHFLDDVVLGRLLSGQGLPYPGGKAVLIEFPSDGFPIGIERALSQIRRQGLLPVIAHPERYRNLWRNADALERVLDVGAAALLDTAALVGKYGSEPRRAALKFLEMGFYHAACSDVHRPADVADVERGMRVIAKEYGDEELELLFSSGPRELLAGRLPE